MTVFWKTAQVMYSFNTVDVGEALSQNYIRNTFSLKVIFLFITARERKNPNRPQRVLRCQIYCFLMLRYFVTHVKQQVLFLVNIFHFNSLDRSLLFSVFKIARE